MRTYILAGWLCLGGALAASAADDSSHARYNQHYATPKNRWFADGDVIVSHPGNGESAAGPAKIVIQMNGHASGDVDEWEMAQTSLWELAASEDGGAWSVKSSSTPGTAWTENPGGTFSVQLPFQLPTSDGSHTIAIEIYGRCTDCRNAIIPPRGKTNWKIPVRLTWSNSGGNVTNMSVTFQTPDQSSNIDGTTPAYFPPRKPGTFRTSFAGPNPPSSYGWTGYHTASQCCRSSRRCRR